MSQSCDTPAEFADRLVDYLLTRTTPWRDEAEVREAVRTAIGLALSEAAHDTARFLPEEALKSRLCPLVEQMMTDF